MKVPTLCNHATDVVGAYACPREAGHPGQHYWWIPFLVGDRWRAIVYAGPAHARRRITRGVFVDVPEAEDIYRLCVLMATVKRMEYARRTQRLQAPGARPLVAA